MSLNANTFSKCAVAHTTNIGECGSVTVCDIAPINDTELNTIFGGSSGVDYKITKHLLNTDLEIKMCGKVQNGLYDFFMANKVNMNKRINTTRLSAGLLQITPFILAKQHDPVNNDYFKFTGGVASDDNWEVTVESTEDVPFDVRWFITDESVFLTGPTPGGTASHGAYVIVSSVAVSGGNTGTLVLAPQNSASNLPDSKTVDVVAGLLVRGVNNVSDYEQFCNEPPALLNVRRVPFWIQTSRITMCNSEIYNKWRQLLIDDNPLYRDYADIDEIEKNRQIGDDWQKRMVNSIFWNKPLANQTTAEFGDLQDIDTPASSLFDATAEGECRGKRANAVGIYEQLAECGRIDDLQGAKLDLRVLFNSLYNIMRIRTAQGSNAAKSIDVLTDSKTADRINSAMLLYYKDKSQDTLRLNIDVDKPASTAQFGFNFRSYPLFWPQGVTMNIVTHDYFDDALTAGAFAGAESSQRRLWILDMSGIYPGIIDSNRVVHNTGDLKKLAEIDNSFACVMKTDTKTTTLSSTTWTVVVECPAGSLVLENFSNEVPSSITPTEVSYPIDGTEESTTVAS